MSKYRRIRLSEIAAVGSEGRLGIRDWLPVRHDIGVKSFGVNVFVARHADDVLVEPHTESGELAGGHEELYFLLAGAALFTIDGDEVTADAGTLIYVPDPETKRGAVAAADNTKVLVVGANAGAPYRASEWERSTIDRYGRRQKRPAPAGRPPSAS